MSHTRYMLTADQLDPLHELGDALSGASDHRSTFRALFGFTVRTTPADGIFVSLYDEATQLRRCVYAAGATRKPRRDAEHDAEPFSGRWSIDEADDVSAFPAFGPSEAPQSRAIETRSVVHTPSLDALMRQLTAVHGGEEVDERPPRSSLAVPLLAENDPIGVFEVQSSEPAAFDVGHEPVLVVAAQMAALAVDNLDRRERERAQREAVLRSLGTALEFRDYETKGHVDRVVSMTTAFGVELELSEQEIDALRWGAFLHDVGKIAIPDQILLKPGPLDAEERRRIEQHTLIGVELTTGIPDLHPVTLEVIRSHHERWDGSGYPDGLKHTSIPLGARMFSLIDVYDALTNDRPYKHGWSHEEAVEEILRCAGTQFDPALISPFERILQKPEAPS